MNHQSMINWQSRTQDTVLILQDTVWMHGCSCRSKCSKMNGIQLSAVCTWCMRCNGWLRTSVVKYATSLHSCYKMEKKRTKHCTIYTMYNYGEVKGHILITFLIIRPFICWRIADPAAHEVEGKMPNNHNSCCHMQCACNGTYSGTWELGTPKGLSKTVLNSEVVLFLRSISM